MKSLIKWISIIVIILIAIAITAPFFIPLDSVKQIVSEKVKQATGRDLVINGEIKASIWPNVGVSLNKVSLSNPEGYDTKNFAEIDNLTVEVALIPLLHKEIKITQFIIKKPIINLETDKNGVANWQFSSTKPSEKTDTETPANSSPKTDKKVFSILPIIGNIKIEDGNFSLKGQKKQSYYNISNVNLETKMRSPDDALNIAADLIWEKEKISISLNADKAEQLMEGGESVVKSSIKIGSLASMAFDGKANIEKINGSLTLNSPSLINLSGLTGKKMDWKGNTKLALDMKSIIECSPSQCGFNKIQIWLDDSVFSGNLKIGFSGKPSIDGKLATAKLDLNNYLPKTDKQAENLSGSSFISNAFAATPSGWSNNKIDFTGLRLVNLNLALSIENLLYQATNLSNISSNIKLTEGNLSVDVPHVELYSGTAKLTATASANNAISLNIGADNVQIEPLLKDFAKFDRLAGITQINASVSGKGDSERAIISSLGGNGKILINDGAIRGIDIAKLVSNAKSIVTGTDTSSEKTNFSELGGTYTISQGIVKNNDLALKAPLLRVKGEGTVDLPNRYVNYRLLPNLVATLKGQGGEDKAGLEIPILVEGNFDKLKFSPDLKGAAQNAIKDPEKVKEAVKNVKETVKGVKGAIKDPEGIKNLLNGFR